LKRPFDAIFAAAALIACAPLMAIVAIGVRWRLGSPVIFSQRRPGRCGRVFRCLKFRTMTDQGDVDGRLLPDEQRLTPFGRWLRSTSVDELPELWNVLRGDMSLVGPRPLLVEYLEHYTAEQARRHEVRPGITGLAQVSGRNALDWPRRLALDVEYVDRASLVLDLQILVRTVVAVTTRRGVSAPGHATTPRLGERSTTAAPGQL
jgi:sugar transferase EpsL